MVYCIADIHGEYDRYKAMLELIQLSDNDTLYILGDVIDRHSDGIEILQDVIARPNVHMILGNHEKMMLDALKSPKDYEACRLWKHNGGGNTYRTIMYKLSPEERFRIVKYISELPDYLEIAANGERFYLVHGMPGETQHDRIWGRPEPPPQAPPIPGKTIICGHTCVYWMHLYTEDWDENAPFEIFYAPGLIDIDCGCGNSTDLRRLACLRLDDMKEFYV